MHYCPICDNDAINCDCTPAERRMHAELEELRGRVAALEAAIETSGLTFRNTDSGPNLVGGLSASPWSRPRWIPVAERLPDDGEDVLGAFQFDDGSWAQEIAFFDNKTGTLVFYCVFGSFGTSLKPSHWMPLPPPPTENP